MKLEQAARQALKVLKKTPFLKVICGMIDGEPVVTRRTRFRKAEVLIDTPTHKLRELAGCTSVYRGFWIFKWKEALEIVQ